MAYLYRHIRVDKNIPFYIGIGNDNKGKYKRAYVTSNRSIHWKNISKNGYQVDILVDNINWEDACKKETEFIKLYGRRDLGLGSLINKTDGGEGNVNGITKETREKMASKLRGRPQPAWQRKILSEAAKGKKTYWLYVPIYQFSLKGEFIKEFESISHAAKELKLQSANIYKSITGERQHCGNFLFQKKEGKYQDILKKVSMLSKQSIKRRNSEIINTKTGNVYSSVKEAAKGEQLVYGTLKSALSLKSKKYSYLQYKNNLYARR